VTNVVEAPPEVRALAELLAERVDAGAGSWRLILDLTDGRLRALIRSEKVGATQLEERFEP
jgi:hypothetical protein